jgi:flagellar biosynthesis/type III secretory pathway M-ring protein FliF/YscJ
MNQDYPQLRKAQTTIEYLLIISVIVLLLVSLFLTMRELRASTQGNVTINNQSQSPTDAISGQLNELRNSTNYNSTNQT